MLAGVLTLTLATSAKAQNIVEIKPDKKVVHVDQLALSSSASVRDALDIMPDLLNRSSMFVIDNFSVQVDGQDVGSSTDVVLIQTILAEVDVIEISTSPSVSDQKNGQSGVINIKMKAPEEGFHGDALLDGSTEWNVMPSVLMSYKKDKWSMKGSMMMEYFQPTIASYTERTSPTSFLMAYDTAFVRFMQETAKFEAKYKTDQDEVKINVWESYAYTKNNELSALCQERLMGGEADRQQVPGKRVVEQFVGTDSTRIENNELNVVAKFNYKHTFSNKGTVETSVNYDFSPTRQTNATLYDMKYYNAIFERLGQAQSYMSDNWNLPHQLSAELKTKHEIGRWSENHYLELEGGANYQLGASESNDKEKILRAGTRAEESILDYKAMTHYVSPFFKFSYFYKTLTLQAGARYQYQNQTIGSQLETMVDPNDTMHVVNSHDWTANININWQVVPHHNLRALASRNLVRPTIQQLSPILYYNQKQDMYYKGNPNLTPTQSYNADLDYSFDFQNVKHNLLLDVGLSYLHVLNPIQQVMREDAAIKSIYNTYENDYRAPTNALNLNLLLCYKVGVYSLFFTGNSFYKLQHKGDALQARWNYNIAMANNFNFASGWALSFKLIYNSAIWTENEVIGDCFFANIRLAKTWGHWLVHAEINDVFNDSAVDKGKDGDVDIMRLYDPHQQCVAVGFAYKW